MQYYVDTRPETIQRIVDEDMLLIKMSIDQKYVYPESTNRVFDAMHDLAASIKKAAARVTKRRPDNSRMSRGHGLGSSTIDFMSRHTF